MINRAWIVLVVGACSSAPVGLRPVLDGPPAESDAYPFAQIDELALAIAREGDLEDIALDSVAIGQDLVLDNVPYGSELVVHLSGRTAGTEVAYGRTCAVDVIEGEETQEPFLYFSRMVRFGPSADLNRQRAGEVLGTAVSGGAFVLGGEDGGPVAEIFVPREGRFRELLGRPTERLQARVARFADGSILLVGGVDGAQTPVSLVERILPDEVSPPNQIQSIEGPQLALHQLVELVDGSVLVTGGLQDGVAVPGKRAFTVSLRDGELTPPDELGATLNFARAQHSMTRLGNEVGADVLIAGGLDETGNAVAQAELYRPLKGAFELIDGATLAVPRYAHRTVRLPGGFLLVVGGLRPDPAGPIPVRELELYDSVQGQFVVAGMLPSSAGVTEMSVTELPDGRFLIAGGLDIDGLPVATTLIASFDPIDGFVDLSPTDSMDSARAGHAAARLCDGTVLVFGGTDAPSTSTERYNPPSSARR